MAEFKTLIDFTEHYTRKFASDVFMREKVDDVWVDTTYETTRHEAHRVAAGLMALGLQKGDRMALLSQGRNMWIIGELGILYAGGVNVPLSVKLEEASDLLFRIQHSDSRFIMTSEQQLPKIRAIIADCPLVEKVIVFDEIEDLQPGEMTMSRLMKMGDEFLETNEGELIARYSSIQPDDYANISYTSGTTADPKGVLLTHLNYTTNVEQARSVVKLDYVHTMLIILPLDHCFAHVCGFYTAMSYGASIATVPVGKTPLASLKNIPRAIQDIRPTIMLSVPALSRQFKKQIETGVKRKGKVTECIFNLALKNAIAYNKDFYNKGGWQSWRWPLVKLFDWLVFRKVRQGLGGRMDFFIGGGAMLDIELQRYFYAIGIPVYQGYGLSEATPVISSNARFGAIFGSSGHLVDDLELKICDIDGNELPDGERGEIVVRGDNVMAGYWKNPVATKAAIVDGWLHTGDMGYVRRAEHPDFLWVTGRFKSLLIGADGEKYSPEHFEDGITDGSPYIDNCILHNNQNPYTIALVVPAQEALSEYCQKKGLDPKSEEGKRAMLDVIQSEVDSYKQGGRRFGQFPEAWLPRAIVVLSEAWTEQNHLVNSTMKVVRGKVEERYQDRIEYAYTDEGKELYNSKNMAAFD